MPVDVDQQTGRIVSGMTLVHFQLRLVKIPSEFPGKGERHGLSDEFRGTKKRLKLGREL